MVIIYVLMQRFEEFVEIEFYCVKIIKKVCVVDFIKEGNVISGVKVEYEGQIFIIYGFVVFVIGGYVVDFGEGLFFQKYRFDIMGFVIINGFYVIGDGQKFVMKIGGNGIDMDKVQVYFIGFVDFKDFGFKWKFLVVEVFCGEGGIFFNGDGDCFCDEFGYCDYVFGMIYKEKDKGKYFVCFVFNFKVFKVFDFYICYYFGCGFMKKIIGKEFVKEIGCIFEYFQKIFQIYNVIVEGKQKDFWGKKFFYNMFFDINDDFYVFLMEFVFYFIMGGIEINDKVQVFNKEGKFFEGFFVCGEFVGGVYGVNCFGGFFFFGCVVYGCVVGDFVVNYYFQQVFKGNVGVVCFGQIVFYIDFFIFGKILVQWGGEQVVFFVFGVQIGVFVEKVVVVFVKVDIKVFIIFDKEFIFEEVVKYNKKEDFWVVVKGVVMDFINWFDDYFGGFQVIFNFMGCDVIEEFEMFYDDEVIFKYVFG